MDNYFVNVQVDDDGTVDYDMLVSLIPDEYYERTTKMIFSCKHLGEWYLNIFQYNLNFLNTCLTFQLFIQRN